MNSLLSSWHRLLSRVLWWEVLIVVGVFTFLVWLYSAMLLQVAQ